MKSRRSMQSSAECFLLVRSSKSWFLYKTSRALLILTPPIFEFLHTSNRSYKRAEVFTSQSGAGGLCQPKLTGPDGGGSTQVSRHLVCLYFRKATKMATRDVTLMAGSAVSRNLVFCFKDLSSFNFSIRSSTTASSAAMLQVKESPKASIQRLHSPQGQNGDQLEKNIWVTWVTWVSWVELITWVTWDNGKNEMDIHPCKRSTVCSLPVDMLK